MEDLLGILRRLAREHPKISDLADVIILAEHDERERYESIGRTNRAERDCAAAKAECRRLACSQETLAATEGERDAAISRAERAEYEAKREREALKEHGQDLWDRGKEWKESLDESDDCFVEARCRELAGMVVVEAAMGMDVDDEVDEMVPDVENRIRAALAARKKGE